MFKTLEVKFVTIVACVILAWINDHGHHRNVRYHINDGLFIKFSFITAKNLNFFHFCFSGTFLYRSHIGTRHIGVECGKCVNLVSCVTIVNRPPLDTCVTLALAAMGTYEPRSREAAERG